MSDVLGVVGLAVAAAIILPHLAANPEILGDLGDAVMVRCEISNILSDVQDNLVTDPDQQRTLALLRWGESVSASDVRDLGSTLKTVAKPATWNAFCTAAGR